MLAAEVMGRVLALGYEPGALLGRGASWVNALRLLVYAGHRRGSERGDLFYTDMCSSLKWRPPGRLLDFFEFLNKFENLNRPGPRREKLSLKLGEFEVTRCIIILNYHILFINVGFWNATSISMRL